MVDATEQWFKENADIEPYELEDFIADIMSAEFDTEFDDGSLANISKDVCDSCRLIQSGRQAEVLERVSRLPKPQLSKCVQQKQDDDDSSDSEEDTAPALVPSMSGASASTSSQSASSSAAGAEKSEPGQSTEEPMEEEDDGWTKVPS